MEYIREEEDMPEKKLTFVYEHKLGSSDYPSFNKRKNEKIHVIINDRGSVDIIGNSKGFLYLAKHFAAIALIKRNDGFHTHLDPVCDLDEESVELSLFNIDHFTEETNK